MWRASDLDPADGPKTRQVRELIRRDIDRGRLAAGSLLPSERDLVRRLGVSRVTVVRAMTDLRAAGIVETRHGFGSVVAPNDRLLDPVAPARARGHELVDLRYATAAAPVEIAELAKDIVAGDRFQRALAADGAPPGGSWEVREALAAQLTAQGTPTRPAHLTLTVGATAALDMVATVLAVGPGRSITETPTYPGALAVLRRHRLEPVGWPAGADGWDLDQAAHLVRRVRPKIMYVQVDNHSPTGQSLAADRRGPLVDLARRHQVPLIADETLRPLWLGEGRQAAPLSRRAGVITVGSLAKAVWGGLSVGWIRASQSLTRRIQASPVAALYRPSVTDELLAMAALSHFDAIVERRCRLLRANLDALCEALAVIPGVGLESPTGGMVAWVRVAERDLRAVVAGAADRGLLVSPGDLSTPDGADRVHLRLPFTASPDQLRHAVRLLADAIAGPLP